MVFDEGNETKVRTDEVKQIRTDSNIAGTIVFEGRAISMSAMPADPYWQIKRVTTSGFQTQRLFADLGRYTQIWNNRASLFPAAPFANSFSTQFDGSNDRVAVASAADINFDRLNPFSVSFWIKTTQTAAVTMVEKQAANVGYRIEKSATGLVEFEFRNAAGNRLQVRGTTTSLQDGNWKFVVCTYTGSSTAAGMAIYINGVTQAITILSDTLTLSTLNAGELTFGSRSGGGANYQGNIDEIAVWNAQLTTAQATEIYNLGQPTNLQSHSFSGSLVSWWRMGDNDTFPTITDNDGLNNGTMTNMTSGDFETEVP